MSGTTDAGAGLIGLSVTRYMLYLCPGIQDSKVC